MTAMRKALALLALLLLLSGAPGILRELRGSGLPRTVACGRLRGHLGGREEATRP